MFGMKLENDSTSFDHTSTTFSGVFFVLRGFDFVSEQKVRSRLVSSGGIDVGHYGPTCTHVIVHKLVYDDPICIAARADGKVLVTGLWVDHSFDVGMPVDTNSVMYAPLRGKDGIPGSESLIVCLTGYQRQDREDIMIMVGLMGAKFSKPLVANKVTHLICYKFEGEKYELAKKMNRIKLINHRWLEDCLKAWTILPEADYDKSGYELEMMEAEAKDSEEEDAASEPRMKQSVDIKNVATPNNLTIKASITPQSKENFSKNLPTSSVSKGLLHTTTSGATLSARQEESLSKRTLNIQESDKRIIQDFTCDEPYLKKTSSTKEACNLVDHLDASRLNSASDLKNTVAENTLPVFKGENRSNSCLKIDVDKANISDGFEAPFFREEEANVGSKTGLVRSPPKDKRSPLSGERKLKFSYGKSKSPKINCDLETCNSGSPSVSNVIKGPVSASSSKSRVDKNASATSIYSSPDKWANVSPTNKLKETISEIEQKSPSKSDSKLDEPCPFSDELENMGLLEHGNDIIVADPEFVSIDCGKRPDPQDSSPEAKSLGVDKSISPKLNTLKGNDCETLGKPVQKKTIAKNNWNLGSRPKVGLSKVKKQKGSFYLSDDVSASTSEINDGEQAEKLRPNLFLDKGMGMETNNVVNPMNEHVDTMEYMDDETEPPEDKQEDQLNAVFRERDEETSEVNLETKDKSECSIPGTTTADDKADGTVCVDEVVDKADDKADGTVCVDEVVDKSENEGICWKSSIESLGKTNSLKLVSGKRKSNEGVSREDLEIKKNNQKLGLNKDKSSPFPIAKAESTLSLEKTDISKKVGQEKIPITTSKRKTVQSVGKRNSKNGASREDLKNNRNQNLGMNKEKSRPSLIATEKTMPIENTDTSTGVRKEITPTVKETSVPLVLGKRVSKEKVSREESENKRKNQKMGLNKEKSSPSPISEIESTSALENTNISIEVAKRKRSAGKTKEDVTNEEPKNKRNNIEKCNPVMTARTERTPKSNKAKRSIQVEKENRPLDIGDPNVGQRIAKAASNIKKTPAKIWSKDAVSDKGSVLGNLIIEPKWFILTGHKLQRKECQQVIKRLRGRVCRDSHKWSYQATHLIYPDPLRRTEKFFAAAASGRWILKTDYLAACNQEGKFLVEEPYEWHKKGLSEDGMINLEAPRKWRLLREKTGHGALHGMRVILYGDSIAPSLDTLKRVIKAGDGTILATSPPYTRFLNSNVDYAIVSPGMPRVDIWVQEFLRHEIPCVVADYLVEYVCKPGYPLERHVQYNTQAWAERSFTNLQIRSQEVVFDKESLEEDVMCEVCRSGERGEVMLICGDESGSLGCGVGTHIDCCDPPLVGVPNEDWFCSKCSKIKKIKDSSKSTKKGRSSKRT